ncbi:A/G-specific adenine glycosylase [Desulfogranum mediterraneum]|uniref:A/G-specific adenine glycosylase n=1 Tax=Desulfogranum mediterraneum TaxID=160661 RepID=UPI000687DE83|nr:A/G-specific adenine glycosylase [Desulfogranum mediterraneum]
MSVEIIFNHLEPLQQRLLHWFQQAGRPLPWREHYHPYQVWISEIMGQQTQMDRVVDYFCRWIERFPTVEAVARAPELEVLKAWEGLGYYSRARNLQRTAVLLVEEYGGEIPDSYGQLLELPGIGPYTAAAIVSIGFNQPRPLLDANVERLFSRLVDIDTPLKLVKTRKRLEQLASGLLHQGDPRSWNQALMEFGALVCTPKRPDCAPCPLKPWCAAHARGTVELRPVSGKRQRRIDITMACGLLQRGDRFYIQQRLSDDIWGGLWEFPGGRLEEGETPAEAAVREIGEETEWEVIEPVPFQVVVHYYTRYRVTLHSFWCTLVDPDSEPVLHAASGHNWVTRAELLDYPFPSGHRQLVEKLLQEGDSG